MPTTTKEEMKTYLRIKAKIECKDTTTQTEQLNNDNTVTNKIVIINPKNIFIDKDKFNSSVIENDNDNDNDNGNDNDDKTEIFYQLPDDYKEGEYKFDDDDEDEYEEHEEIDDEIHDNDDKEKITDDYSDEEYKPYKENKKINKNDKRLLDYAEKNYYEDEIKFFKKLKTEEKKSIISLEKNINKCNDISTPLRFKILQSDMDIKLKAHAIQKLNSLYDTQPGASEYNKLINYIESIAKLPINKYKNLPCNKYSSTEEISTFINNVNNKLDKAVYGHKETKNQIIRLLAQWISNPKSNGLVIGLEGHPGVGKTCLIKNGVANALDLPFGFVSLGGSSDSAYLTGHSYTYEGSKYGKIAEILMNSKYMNPVLFFDELDKVSNTRYGEEIISLLIHLTDSSQNDHFQDKYFSEIPLDLSKCLIIFSYNNINLINPILKDRMITIKINDYTINDKIIIAKNYMIPELLEKYAFKTDDIIFTDDILKKIIDKTTTEKGVRNFKRNIDEILSRINLSRLLSVSIFDENKTEKINLPINIDDNIISKLLIKKTQDIDISVRHIYT